MKHLLSLFLFVSLFFSCTDIDESRTNVPDAQSSNSALGVSANFIKLADDSTQTAGVLEFTTTASELSVKWNVNPQFNLDTTVNKLSVSGGKCQLPIKWVKKLKYGTYGPMGTAFSGGVMVKSGNDSRYIRLIWADKIDSTKVAQSAIAMTRASDEETLPPAIVSIEPVLLELDKDTCGKVTVTFDNQYGLCMVYIDHLNNLVDYGRPTGLDLMAMPGTVEYSPTVVEYKWEGGVAPKEGFMAHVEYNVGDFSAFSYFRYKVPTPAEFEYISNEPETTELLDATKAYVIVKVNTNKVWSLECDDSEIKTVKSPEDATGTQMLVLQVSDNPSENNRTIRVRVKSQGELVKELVYTQKPKAGTFKVLEVTPSEDVELSSDPQDIKVKVETTVPWWIMVNGEKKEFAADKQEGIFTVPEYIGKDSRKLNVIIGYGDTQVEIYNYTQKAGDSVQYKTNNLTYPIPLEGGTYTFTFEGLYAGDIQMRVLKSDSTILANGIPVTNLNPTVTVPNNYGSLAERDVIFQYRLGTGKWFDIAEANRPQTGAVIDKQVLPSGSIPAEGGGYSCVFSGSYTGKVFLRATIEIEGGDSIIIGEGNCPGAVSVKIPPYTGDSERKVTFDYSVDKNKWSDIDKRMQYAQTIKFTPISPEGIIPAVGGAYRSTFSGTYTGQITFRARLVDGTVLDSERKILDLFELNIPANPAETVREIIFEYSRNGTDGWVEVERKFQSGKVKVDTDKPNVGDLEDGGNNNNEVEL